MGIERDIASCLYEIVFYLSLLCLVCSGSWELRAVTYGFIVYLLSCWWESLREKYFPPRIHPSIIFTLWEMNFYLIVNSLVLRSCLKTCPFHLRLVFRNSIHQEVASDSFCFLINSSWLLVFILYVFSLFFSGFNIYWWKGIHFS